MILLFSRIYDCITFSTIFQDWEFIFNNHIVSSFILFVSGLVWHSLRNSLHHLEILALDTPYSAVMLL